jgi:hypothetical protein
MQKDVSERTLQLMIIHTQTLLDTQWSYRNATTVQ